jgi:MYXO-CTERM domain-containing protein
VLCLADDTCDGSGVCTDNGFASASTSCRAAAGSCDLVELCDGAGSCPSDGFLADGDPGSPACTPYLCNGSSADCPTTCATNDDCAANHRCEGTTCVPDRANGEACTAATQCASGNCVDSVCCNAPCDGACESCDQASSVGACTTDPDGTTCDGGVCDGGMCVPGGQGGEGGTAGAPGTGGDGTGGGGTGGGGADDLSLNDEGCGCHVVGAPQRPAFAWVMFLALAAAIGGRRRPR